MDQGNSLDIKGTLTVVVELILVLITCDIVVCYLLIKFWWLEKSHLDFTSGTCEGFTDGFCELSQIEILWPSSTATSLKDTVLHDLFFSSHTF